MQDSELDLGTRLREARRRRARTLQDIAASTRIPVEWLAAIERNEFADLPQGIFRRAYVRAFAAEVGVEAEPLPEALLPNPDVTLSASRDSGMGQWRHQIPTALTVLLLATILVLARLTSNPDGDAVSPARSAPEFAAYGVETAPLETSEPALTTDDTLPRPRASLTMTFLGSCWVSATADGRRVIHRLVKEGEHLEIEGRDGIAVELGDAGAVLASINGGSPRVLGADGEVLRMKLTPSESTLVDAAV
jgi:transcriptional regulator with XRE-family HTH domain